MIDGVTPLQFVMFFVGVAIYATLLAYQFFHDLSAGSDLLKLYYFSIGYLFAVSLLISIPLGYAIGILLLLLTLYTRTIKIAIILLLILSLFL